MKTLWDWIITSSANPEKYSLTIKSAGVLAIPYILGIAKSACGFGLICFGVDASGLNSVVDVLANIAEWGLSIVGGAAFLYGFVRKIILTSGA